jgi:hypothetical protein
VATFADEDVQFTTVVRSRTPPSTKVPLAVNCVDVWLAIWTVVGAVLIEICCGEATKRVAVPLTDPSFAVIVDRPTPCPVATPDSKGMVATFVGLDDQVDTLETSWIELSLKLPIAE